MGAATLLEVEDLHVRFHTRTGIVEAVRGLSFSLGREKLGVVGESGSGKSMTGRAILGLVPPPGEVTASRLSFAGQDLLRLDDAGMRAIRGRRISRVLQDPKFSLNPDMRGGDQVAEAYRQHHRANRTDARARAIAMLEQVRIRDARRVYDLYPHEVSGGMGQRIMIAMMLIPEPDVIIADEPTSALDVTVQMQVLAILDDLVTQRGMGLVFISHDLALVGSFCDRVVVMYGGRAMETLAARDLAGASHPYTRGLLSCLPSLDKPVAALPTLVRDPAWMGR
ncbi:MAG: ABC transporter ATP-binding protein [Alphaproteobacteria bacterium]